MSIRPFLWLITCVLLAGCQSEPDSGTYRLPPADSPVAMLRGSIVRGATFLEGSHEARVRFIDMLKVPERGGPETPVPVAVGRHKIMVTYRNNTFRSQAELSFEAVAGGDYRVRVQALSAEVEEQRFCEYWVENAATGAVLGEKVVREVRGNKRESLFRVVD